MQCAVYVMDIDRSMSPRWYASDIDSWQLSQHKTKRTERIVGNKYFPNNVGGREENKMCKLASRPSEQCKQAHGSVPANLPGTPLIILVNSLHWLSFYNLTYNPVSFILAASSFTLLRTLLLFFTFMLHISFDLKQLLS